MSTSAVERKKDEQDVSKKAKELEEAAKAQAGKKWEDAKKGMDDAKVRDCPLYNGGVIRLFYLGVHTINPSGCTSPCSIRI